MRTLCDACESAAAAVFCAADEAALCHSCDEKVHMCNKLASRHVRVGLASPSDVPRCDICENAPAFFYCEVDGTSLCLHCDMIVHVGGKRTHERYLLLRQRVEFPGDKANCEGSAVPPPAELGDTRRGHPQNQNSMPMAGENHNNNSREPALCPPSANDADKLAKVDSKMIDLNTKPHRVHELTPFNEEENDKRRGVASSGRWGKGNSLRDGRTIWRVPPESHVAPTIERILSPMNKDTSETARRRKRRDGMQPLLEKEVWEVGEKERIQWRAGIYTDAI